MSDSKKKTPAEELIESLLKDVGGSSSDFDQDAISLSDAEDGNSSEECEDVLEIEGLIHDDGTQGRVHASENFAEYEATKIEYEATRVELGPKKILNLNPDEEAISFDDLEADLNDAQTAIDSSNVNLDEQDANLFAAMGALQAQSIEENKNDFEQKGPSFIADSAKVVDDVVLSDKTDANIDTELLSGVEIGVNPKKTDFIAAVDSEKTVAVAGYQLRPESNYDDRVKVSVGQNRAATGYQSWSGGAGGAESNLAQAENLRIAQEKIIELEHENEKLRLQNEELVAASEIIKERSDLLSSQLNEYKNDREGLEESFKSEIVLLKNHLIKKETELQKAQFKIDEMDSRLKFDMKKIRVRERELENRLEIVRAEKNAIVKNKDEQILDLKRKMDVLQMEVESYRQKCIELNKSIESSQESFKRTTRALRLAMANLELQDENTPHLKKVD